jgi:hypothetical protein
MGWIRYPELKGKVFVPQAAPDEEKKHPCPDCFACQMCSDERCQACCKQAATQPMIPKTADRLRAGGDTGRKEKEKGNNEHEPDGLLA